MLCEKCHKNIATTHIKTVVNGVKEEKHLCNTCASIYGVSNGFDNTLAGMLTSIFSDSLYIGEGKADKKCECCGSTFSDIAKSGKLGCGKCYETFFDKLLPYLQRVHGSVRHLGKVPVTENSYGAGYKGETAEDLKKKLKELIDEERFEEAAVIRDKIKAIEETGK